MLVIYQWTSTSAAKESTVVEVCWDSQLSKRSVLERHAWSGITYLLISSTLIVKFEIAIPFLRMRSLRIRSFMSSSLIYSFKKQIIFKKGWFYSSKFWGEFKRLLGFRIIEKKIVEHFLEISYISPSETDFKFKLKWGGKINIIKR